jgi:hypothetical protein
MPPQHFCGRLPREQRQDPMPRTCSSDPAGCSTGSHDVSGTGRQAWQAALCSPRFHRYAQRRLEWLDQRSSPFVIRTSSSPGRACHSSELRCPASSVRVAQRLMGVLRSIVHAQSLFGRTRKADFSDRRAIGFQFLGHDCCGNETLASKRCSQKLQCRNLLTSNPDEDWRSTAMKSRGLRRRAPQS